MVRGQVMVPDEVYEITLYSLAMNLDKGLYYYRTYEDSKIRAFDLNRENLEWKDLVTYPLIEDEEFEFQN